MADWTTLSVKEQTAQHFREAKNSGESSDECLMRLLTHEQDLGAVLVYALVDPRNDEIRYVGQSGQPSERFKDHLYRTENKRMREWLEALSKEELEPNMKALEVVTDRDPLTVEWEYIQELDETNDLVNSMAHPRKRP